jgi:hypothetical protein
MNAETQIYADLNLWGKVGKIQRSGVWLFLAPAKFIRFNINPISIIIKAQGHLAGENFNIKFLKLDL